MKTTDIEKILKQGSVRQKIKLYMTDIALVNVDWSNLDYEINGKGLDIKGTKLLTSTEREIIWSSIKERNDIKYYNELKTYNEAFLIFKDKFSINLTRLQALYYHITISNAEEIGKEESTNLVNEILDLIPDKKTREIVLKKAIDRTKGEGGREYQEKGYPKYLAMDRAMFWEDIKKPMEIAIATSKVCKEYIVMFKIILTDSLPLKPYKDWVEAQEKFLKKLITAISDVTKLEDTPPGFPKIEPYEEIEAQITDEDVEDFKKAGI